MFSFYTKWSEEGLRLPSSYDPVSKLPSVTLFFSYISFFIMVISLIGLHFYKQFLEATIISVFVWILSVVFYRLRELDKISLNVKTGSIGIEDDNLSQKDAK